jgi:hypothetical protein
MMPVPAIVKRHPETGHRDISSSSYVLGERCGEYQGPLVPSALRGKYSPIFRLIVLDISNIV